MGLRIALTAVSIVVGLLGRTPLEGATDGRAIALFPTQNRAGDSVAAEIVDRTLRLALGVRGRTIDAATTRDALRRFRIRNGDGTPPGLMRRLAGGLGADWLVSTTLHDADRHVVPQMTVSIRLYSGATGELIWAGFKGGSGLDHRKLLGLGVIRDLDSLVPVVMQDLFEGLAASFEPGAPGSTPAIRLAPDGLGTVAIVPFAGSTARRITANAETVTEAARADLLASGTPLVSPNRSFEILRRLQAGQWGGVTAETRAVLHERGGADSILTGAVEAYEISGSELEPEPRVTVAMRLVDARSGRILWTGSQERGGGDGLNLIGIGRIHSRGALTQRVVGALADRLHRAEIRVGQPSGNER